MKYTLYDEIVTNHTDEQKTCLTFYPGDRSSYTYRQINDLVNRQVPSWQKHNVTKGSKIAILNTFGIDQVVNVLTAIKLGCIFSVLDISSPLLAQHRLQILKPDFFTSGSADHNLADTLNITGAAILESQTGPSDGVVNTLEAVSYNQNDIAAITFDNRGTATTTPVELSALVLYKNLKRNASMLMLKPDDILVFPISSHSEYQPGLVLTALFAGVRFIDIPSSADVLKHMTEISGQSQSKNLILGVSHSFRNILLKYHTLTKASPFDTEKVKFWFNTPNPTSNLEAWRKFVTTITFKESGSSCLYWENALYGFTFKSLEKAGIRDTHILLDGETQYEILDMYSGNTIPKGLGNGFYSEKVNPRQSFVSNRIVSPQNKGYFCIENEFIGKSGMAYPEKEITGFLEEQCSSSARFCFIQGQQTQNENSGKIILLVFSLSPKTLSAEEYKTLIEEKAGSLFIPDEIIIFRYYPRAWNVVDTGWVKNHYLSGRLQNISHIHYLLSSFRVLLQQLKNKHDMTGLPCLTVCHPKGGELR